MRWARFLARVYMGLIVWLAPLYWKVSFGVSDLQKIFVKRDKIGFLLEVAAAEIGLPIKELSP